MSLSDDYHALRRAAGIVDRSTRGRLVLTGADRRSYLQGLLSNDIDALVEGSGCYATYLTAQGRMIADMRVFETGDSLLVDLDGTLAGGVADRWSRFIFSEDVQVRNDSARHVPSRCLRPAAARILARTLCAPGALTPPISNETLRGLPLNANRRWEFRGQPLTCW